MELVPALAQMARELHPSARILQGELLELAGGRQLSRYDLVVASGIFNARLRYTNQPGYIYAMLRCMFELAQVAVACDFMTSFVDYQHPEGWHMDPGWAMAAARSLSRRVFIRADYMPYEFALFIFKDQQVDEQGVFRKEL